MIGRMKAAIGAKHALTKQERMAANRERKTRARLAAQVVFEIIQKETLPGRPSYVQVGANDGILADQMYNRTKTGEWAALMLEPSPHYFARLQETYAGADHVTRLNVGVSDKAGSMPLFYLDPKVEQLYPKGVQGGASLLRGQMEKVAQRNGGDVYDPTHIIHSDVALERLDKLVVDHGFQNADGLIVDVEGYETTVFNSFSYNDFRPRFTMFERIQISKAETEAINAKHADAGYRVYEMNADNLAIRKDWLTPTVHKMLELLGVAQVA
ncbi:MAG: FkbM family methyltransferase [Pikeienuella sp.]